ncbi:MAG: DUF3418 domain-containing protein, partial [Paracoccaceae bacterium]
MMGCGVDLGDVLGRQSGGANDMHRAGLRRLCLLAIGRQARNHIKQLPNLNAIKLRHGPLGDAKTLQENLTTLAVDIACLENQKKLPRTQAE